MAPLLLALLPALAAAAPPIGWATGSVRHKFFDTPKGQIHYVVRGGPEQLAPLVLQHSHPRSTVEWKYIAEALGDSRAFLALDYYGFGLSEDYKGDAAAGDEFCTFQEWSRHVLDILEHEGIRDFVSVGTEKGAHPAIELAHQAGERAKHLIVMNPLILSPNAKAFINGKLIPMLRNSSLSVDGSHLTRAWTDPSAAPFDGQGKPSEVPRDLLGNEEKTIDSLRCLSTGWQYDAAWTAYNEQNELSLRAIDAHARTLVVLGNSYLAECETYGLDPNYSVQAFDEALKNKVVDYVEGGSEGMPIQNSTYIANLMSKFLHNTANIAPVSAPAVDDSDSTCSNRGHCGLAYQACCAGFVAKGYPCGCHLKDGNGTTGADCGTCGTAYSLCCAAYAAKGFPCTCDISSSGGTVVV